MILRFGIIGVGYFGKHYVRLLQEMESAELMGVMTRSPNDLPPHIKQYGSANELINDPNIDCVIIATPPSTHADLAVASIGCGKHVLLEKPMCSTLAEAHRIADAVKKTDRIFMVGHQYCYNNYIRQLKKEIDAKTIGNIRYLFAQHFYTGPVRLDIGCLWETATHELAMIDYLFPDTSAIHISGDSVDIMQTGRDDATTVMIFFDNGLHATLATNWFAPKKVRRMIMAGPDGMAVFDEKEEHALALYRHPYPIGETPESHTSHFFEIKQEEIYIPNVSVREPLRNELDHFIACIHEHRQPLTGIEHGLRVTTMLDRIASSLFRV